tara:strand:- start:235 stop:435 length:201 start_codon:yes stop_codon:yes gene_type:complete
MEQTLHLFDNSTNLLFERIFWVGIGIFLGATFLKTGISAINFQQNNPKNMEDVLRKIAQKAVQSDD